jgi:CRISPR-associated protein Cmr5
MAKTLGQKRAEYAFQVIEKIKSKDFASELSSLISKMPSYILTNGLGNTLAFLFSKGKEQHLFVAGIIADWILRKYKIVSVTGNFSSFADDWFLNTGKVKEKMKDITENLVLKIDMYNYTVATDEILSLLVWLKRFSEGMIEKKEG